MQSAGCDMPLMVFAFSLLDGGRLPPYFMALYFLCSTDVAQHTRFWSFKLWVQGGVC